MPTPLLPLYQALSAANARLTQVQAEAAATVSAATAEYATAQAALIAEMPEGVEFSTVAEHPPVIKRVGNEVVLVTKPSIHEPYTPEAGHE